MRKCSHGKHKTRVYKAWENMKTRCTNPKHNSYHNYGGRGITFDPAWADFKTFYADMGDPPEGTSLDRTDNDAPYSKKNCRWATKAEQLANRRITRKVNGLPLAAAAEVYGTTPTALRKRMDRYGVPYLQRKVSC